MAGNTGKNASSRESASTTQATTQPETKVTEKPENSASIYTVKAGDSLQSIAEDSKVDVGDLMRLNPEINNTNFVYEDQVIRLK